MDRRDENAGTMCPSNDTNVPAPNLSTRFLLPHVLVGGGGILSALRFLNKLYKPFQNQIESIKNIRSL